jgi:hypothetical protein
MSGRNVSRLGAPLLVLLAGLTWPLCWGEVGAVHVSQDADGYIVSLIDDPDPVPSWQPITPESSVRVVLNPEGSIRGDGAPRIIDHPTTGVPMVVWSRNTNPGFDVVISRFVDGAWSQPQVLAGSADAELDPAIAIDPSDGSVHVVYWVLKQPPLSSSRVMHIQSTADLSSWSSPVEVSQVGELAAHPFAAFHGGQLHVVYQSAFGDGPPYYVLLATRTGGTWAGSVLLGTSQVDGAQPEIHSQGSELWAEWIDAVGSMAWVERAPDNLWGAPQSEGYTTSEDRDYFARGRIRGKALD